MSEGADPRWILALAAVDLIAARPDLLGGVLVRARAGPVRDAWLAALARALPERLHRLPSNPDLAALDGGLDLTATLASGRPVQRAGLLAQAAGGVVVVPMAERLAPGIAARLAAAVDAGEVALVLLDEGDGDEGVAEALGERVAMWIDLGEVRVALGALLDLPRPVIPAQAGTHLPKSIPRGEAAELTLEPQEMGPRLRGDDDSGGQASSLATAAIALGIESIRAPIHALRIARATAALQGRATPTDADLELAAALVLGPRATRLPPDADDTASPHDPPPPPETNADQDSQPDPDTLSDQTEILLDSARTALPPGLLAALESGATQRGQQRGSGGGAKARSLTHGRPAGVRPGTPGRGARLALIETITAAAPWQRLRQREGETARLHIRRDDLRVRRFVARQQATTVFAVDASGSAAIARMAEAKGAVELLLAAAYVKRAEVALVSFRGSAAELLLPPTRSLARAKRQLAELAGGGGTPLAAGLDMARQVAEIERGKGRTPLVVVLTDGRANVAENTDLSPQDAALASGRAFGASGLKSVFIDTGKRPRAEAAAVAAAMGARYVALPRLDAQTVVAAVEAGR